MATEKCIALEIAKLSIYYTYPERSAAEQAVLTRMWTDDLGDISDAEMRAAVAAWRRGSRYWPTVADLLDIVDAERASKRAARVALPEVQTPEETAKCLANTRKVLREVCGREE